MNFFNGSCGGGFNGCAGGCDACSLLTWIILLQCLCGNGNGCGMDMCTLIILLLLCGCCGNNCGGCKQKQACHLDRFRK